jgi:hypothetical protein
MDRHSRNGVRMYLMYWFECMVLEKKMDPIILAALTAHHTKPFLYVTAIFGLTFEVFYVDC